MLCIIVCITSPVAARTYNPFYINPYGDAVGGEPGEDPHLRLPVPVQTMEDGSASTLAEVSDKTSYPVESFQDECLDEDSRVRILWSIVLRAFFDVLPR